MCTPFQEALAAATDRRVIVGDYYDANIRRRTKRSRSPSLTLANRARAQLGELGINFRDCDFVTHSYGSEIANHLTRELGSDGQVIMVAPAGLGGVDLLLSLRFAIGMGINALGQRDTVRFAVRGALNTLRRVICQRLKLSSCRVPMA